MTRKINTKNLYKLLRNTMLIVSFLCLLVGAIYTINYDGIAHRAFTNTQDCLNDFPSLISELCGVYYKELSTVQNIIYISLAVGFGLPMAFFGIKTIINYVTKEDK